MNNKQNQLSKEKSPYLLQHQNNPVFWYPWGDEAFALAKQENKPIFLSVGYSTCHWCHVMAHQSFEDQAVADFLNEHFISIKLDREERPDVDEIYMSALHLMGQRGGWPLSMFLTPDLKPFYGGTYWPKENFLYILQQIVQLWQKEPQKALESSAGLVDHLKEHKTTNGVDTPLDNSLFQKFFDQSVQSFDPYWGGFGSAPKFPHAQQIAMLLRIYRRSQNLQALHMAEFSLDKMARGGLYDHMGGGFTRYSTDEKWRIPHFEKMLYDNALLVPAYLEAFQATQKSMFARVASETLNYVIEVMQSPEGAFYSAQDADSEGEEGKYYVWTLGELKDILSEEELESLSQVYPVTESGNFEHQTNHFYLAADLPWEVKDQELIQSARKKLLHARSQRIPPHLDDKVLSSWNGLMIRAMALAYQILGEEKYLQAAHAAAGFIKKNLWRDSTLYARYREGDVRFIGRSEDYAYLIQGLIDLYQCDFKPEILQWALELQESQNKKFWDEKKTAYFFTEANQVDLLFRTQEGMDGALPSPNGVSALNLLRLSSLTLDQSYRKKAQEIFSCFSQLLKEYPHVFSQMMIAWDYFSDSSKELAISTANEDEGVGEFLKKLRQHFQPNLVLALGTSHTKVDFPMLLKDRMADETAFYVCENKTCHQATNDPQLALKQALTYKSYEIS
ncbi:MAG: thioredoxin domain-containing protein [Deltaproteobacteria bacterium]|nr:thioredoxin domain-containing protein [Deltaproteobacteria bacterium]